MSDSTVENLILDLLEWISREERTYEEVMDAWRTSCPRFPVWEEATDRGLVATTSREGRRVVNITSAGVALLEKTRR
jgi:D-3-phosphoglycerate dehydrogenase